MSSQLWRVKTPTCIFFLGFVGALWLQNASDAQPQAGQPTPAATPANGDSAQAKSPDTRALPDKKDEVNGTCLTPRQAYLQLIWWQIDGRNDLRKAAACFDVSGLRDPNDAGERARKLLGILDANDIKVPVDTTVPVDPNYKNPQGLHRYDDRVVNAAFPGIAVVKQGDRWLFTPESLDIAEKNYSTLANFAEKHLPSWLRAKVLNIEVWKYLCVFLLIFIALAFRRVSVFFIRTYVRRLLGRQHRYLDMAIARADRPLGGLAMALVFHIGFPLLVFPLRVSNLAMVATEALAAFSLVWLAYRMIDVLGDFMGEKAEKTESKLDDQLVPLVTKTFKVFVSVIGGIFILQNLNVNVGSLLAGLGLGGLAFALAAKDTIANFFGSVMIFIDKPFQIGDWVTIGDTEGVVEEVGFRTTRVRTFYNSLITVPNAIIVQTAVDNFGARKFRRYNTTLGLTYDTPPDKVQAFCEGVRAIVAGMPGMRKDYYLVEFKDFGASSLNIMLYCFMVSATWNDELRTRSNLNLEIMRLAEQLGVGFAFPTQTLHVDTLAKAGEPPPSSPGPQSKDEIAAVINGFGPGGAQANPARARLGRGYECDRKWTESQDGDGAG